MVPLLLYAGDLIILMSESTAGLQKQMDALAGFCDDHNQPQQHTGSRV